ncbi:MAG: S1C family serine protease [Thermoplasmata archaeon]
MNAAIHLLRRATRSSVRIEASIPERHPSAQILGTSRVGSGSIVASEGLILTVNYVVLGANALSVTLQDGQELPADLAAMDLTSGLALLRVEATSLPALSFATSRDLRLGDEVFVVSCIGESNFRVADGFVTYLGPFDANWEYTLDRAIMSSALNPGLGGGALVDRLGRAVGVVSLSLNTVGKFTLGIPGECYLDHRDELVRHGRRRTLTPRAWLGVFCHTMQDHVVIAGLLPGAPAERAGLKQGDVILTIDGRGVADRRALYDQLWTHRAGDAVNLQIFRDNEVQTVRIPTVDVEEFFA